MYSKLVLLAIAAIISGCASVSTSIADKTSLADLRGQAISLKVAEPNSFVLSTPENNRSFGRVIVMMREGKELVATNGVVDPAQAIASGISQRLATAYGTNVVPTGAPAKLSLEVKTTNWGLYFSGDDKNVYGMVYTATFELIDVQRGRTIASGYCKPAKGEFLTAPREQLMNNSGAGLKDGLSDAASKCVKYISEQILTM